MTVWIPAADIISLSTKQQRWAQASHCSNCSSFLIYFLPLHLPNFPKGTPPLPIPTNWAVAVCFK